MSSKPPAGDTAVPQAETGDRIAKKPPGRPSKKAGRGRPHALAAMPPTPPPTTINVENIFPSSIGQPQRPVAPPKTRRRILSALLFVAVPLAAAIAYFGFLATDQFYASADYAIRFSQGNPSTGGQGGGGALGVGQALGAAAALSDMYILSDYILSHQILEDLQPRLDIRAIYSNPKADHFARLDPSVSEEKLLEYWRSVVSVRCDMTTGISHLGVRAFTPEDAKKVADEILGLSEDLVNRLSDRAQSDRVGLAQKDVEEAYARVTKALDALRVYQEQAKQVSPEGFVQARSEIEARIGQEITRYEAQIERLSSELPENAPGIRQLRNRLKIAREQLEAERSRSTISADESKTSASEVFTEFSKLKLESEFAAKAYDSALTSLEQARLDAAKQDRYLEAFVRPQLPDAATYPRRMFNIILIAVASCLVWSIGGLTIAAIREHI